MGEKALARRWRVNFTPTVNFFPPTVAETAGKSGRDAEVARMPGYLKPAHFLTYMEFVKDEGYRKESFQRYLLAKFRAIHDKGRRPVPPRQAVPAPIVGANAMRRLVPFLRRSSFWALRPTPAKSRSAATACIIRTGSSRVFSI